MDMDTRERLKARFKAEQDKLFRECAKRKAEREDEKRKGVRYE